MKSGFISIIGKTNAGKSTLINALTKSKISICTPKPQTTRNSIQGIYNDDDSQIVFIDTPGFLSPHQKLDEYMNKQAFSSLNGIDGVILLVDSSVFFNKDKDSQIQNNLKTLDVPLFIVFNKIDLTNIYLINNLKKEYQNLFPNAEIIEISAEKKVNLDLLLNKIKNILPEGYKYYPDNIKSDHPISFLIGEIIREKLLLFTREEVPHSCAVKIEKIEKNNNSYNILSTIICERNSQKVIIVGKNGSMIKRIGIAARKDIEKLLDKKVNLETFVRVEERWRNDDNYLKEFGYKDEE
ncbi:MAG: GTPase Era [Bacilli bacterium]|nr:GTPase Era [Bacillales bacterium]MDY2575287.1 GTPase Era [Bacilli bacterium]